MVKLAANQKPSLIRNLLFKLHTSRCVRRIKGWPRLVILAASTWKQQSSSIRWRKRIGLQQLATAVSLDYRVCWPARLPDDDLYRCKHSGDLLNDVWSRSVYCGCVHERLRIYLLVFIYLIKFKLLLYCRPPLWSSGQSFWLQIQRSRVRFPALPDFSE